MAEDDTPPPAGARSGSKRRRPPTIDLPATEIAGEPVSEQQAAAAEQPAAQGEGAPEQPQPETARPSEQAADAAARPPPSRPEPRLRRGWWRVAATAAVILLLAVEVGLLLSMGRARMQALDGRIGQVEAQLRQVRAAAPPPPSDAGALDELRSRVGRLETATAQIRTAPVDADLANRISSIEGQVKTLADNIEAFGRRSDEAAATAREARERVEVMSTALAQLTANIGQLAAQGQVEALTQRVAAIESEMAKRQATAVSDRAGRLAIAATALDAGVERGTPFAAELATARSLGADAQALAALEPFAATGVPSPTALARELAGLVPALQQAAASPPRDGGFLDRLAANAEKLVRIRRVEAVSGNDPGAVVSRIEFKALHGDLAGALGELAALPEPARAPAEDWIKRARARAEAIDASRRLADAALAGLTR